MRTGASPFRTLCVASAALAIAIAACSDEPRDATGDGSRVTTTTAPSSDATPIDATPAFNATPDFLVLETMTVTIDGRSVPLGESDLKYVRRPIESFDDPATSGHDGIAAAIRRFLACETDSWSIGSQTFTVDGITAGVARRDDTMVANGVRGIDWGLALDVTDEGVHRLRRECDGTTVADFGGTHHTTQWLESLGRAVYLLRSSDLADEYGDEVGRIIARMEKLARLLADPDNTQYWEERWLVDDDGNVFTHKLYMRAAALELTASLTDDGDDAARWAAIAADMARRAMDGQRGDGVNPERGDYDVSYQMYGTWLAQLYYSLLPDSESMKTELGSTIDRAIEWMSGRIDDVTGQVDIGTSTRTCSDADDNQPYEAADAVRAFLLWSEIRGDERLAEQAVLIDQGDKSPGNPCPAR